MIPTERLILSRQGRKRRKWPVVLVVAVAITAILGIAGWATIRPVPSRGGTLIVNLGDSSRFINPLLASTDTDSSVSDLVFWGLTRRTASGALTRGLAQSWHVAAGGSRYTFHLRRHLRWQNGKPVTSFDVAYSYRLLGSRGFPSNVGGLPGLTISTPNAYTVVFHLPHPDYTLPEQATMGIVPNKFGQSSWPVGSGTYAVGHVTSTAISLTSRKGPQRPWISRLRFQQGKGGARGALVCRSTIMSGVSNRKKIGNRVFVPATRVLGLTMSARALPDFRVRRGILAAAAHGGVRFMSPTPNWPSTGTRRRLKFPNPQRLMREAGWSLRSGRWQKAGHPLVLKLAVSSDPGLSPIVSHVSKVLRRAGFSVSISRLPFARLVRQVLYPGAFDAAIVEWDFGSPDYDPGTFWASSADLDFGHAHDPVIDKLAAKFRDTRTRAARNRARTTVGRHLIADGAAVGLGTAGYSCNLPNGLSGYKTPSLVTNAGGLFSGEDRWYLNTQISLHNPF